MRIKNFAHVMLVLSILMTLSPFVEPLVEAYHCADEIQDVNDANTDLNLAIGALVATSLTWVAACSNTKTIPRALTCAAATIAFGVAIAAELTMRGRYERALTAFNTCNQGHQN